jgi:predicted RNA-binding protein
MCESTVWLRERGGERILMKEVAAVRPVAGRLVLTSILGDRLEVDGVLAELDLLGHRVVVEARGSAPPR